jgi:phage terminase large subunit GpA-like protein
MEEIDLASVDWEKLENRIRTRVKKTIKKKFKLSRKEAKLFSLPERFPATEVVNFVKISGTTNIMDRISLDLTPYIIDPLSLVGVRGIETVGIIGPTQGGKSVFLQLVVADTISQDPGTLIYTFPDEKSAKKAIEDKIVGMVKRTPELWDKVAEPKSKNLSVSLMRFVDMIIQPAWGGSLGTLSSTPAKRAIIDEARLLPLAIGAESNVFELLRDRLTTFLQKGMGQLFPVSTPSVEGDLLHQQTEKPFTTVLHLHSQCPNCNKYQVLDFFKNVKWDQPDASDAKCYCKYCGEPSFVDDDQKIGWNINSKYAPFDPNGANWEGQTFIPDKHQFIGRNKHVYFWFNSLNSPFRSFTRIAQKFLEVRAKPHDYKNFIQAWLAQFWKISTSNLTSQALKERRIDLPRGVVPHWCKVITAGADTQDNGFYVTFRAHGSCRQTHLIDHVFIPCDMNSTIVKDVAKTLREQVEERVFSSEEGEKWQVGRWSFDTGGHRENEMKSVVEYLSKATRIKGRNSQQAVSLQPSSNIPGLWFARTYEYLESTENECTKKYWTLHSDIDDDYSSQFLAAKKIVEFDKKTNIKKVTWGKDGQTDYRMAEIHNFITLDLPFSNSTLRRYLEEEGWKYNPYDLTRRSNESEKREIESTNGLEGSYYSMEHTVEHPSVNPYSGGFDSGYNSNIL